MSKPNPGAHVGDPADRSLAVFLSGGRHRAKLFGPGALRCLDKREFDERGAL